MVMESLCQCLSLRQYSSEDSGSERPRTSNAADDSQRDGIVLKPDGMASQEAKGFWTTRGKFGDPQHRSSG